MSFIKNLQKLPYQKKKLILYLTLTIVGICLFILWIFISYQKIKHFDKEKFIQQINFPAFQKELEKNREKLKIPPEMKEKLEKLEELQKALEEEKSKNIPEKENMSENNGNKKEDQSNPQIQESKTNNIKK